MKELPLSLTINGVTYYSQHHLATTQTAWYDRGKKEGYEEGKKAYGYSVDDIKQLHTDYSHIHHLWFDKGYNVGKSAGYKEGYDAASIKYFDEYSVKMEEKSKSRYDAGYNDGYEQCKHDGISPKEIPGEYLSHIEEAYDDGYKEGYTDCREVAKMLNKYGIDEDGVAE
jgi:flagellar biosynthesis/type III secretory pathway protein FliH